MKTKAPKSHSSVTNSHSSKPFFNKSGEGSFFSKAKETEPPFFSPSIVQTKLTIGKPNDKYEQEADQVADQVVQRLEQPNPIYNNQEAPSISLKPISISPIQRKCEACEGEEKLQKKEDEISELEVMRKPIFESKGDPPDDQIQTKSNHPNFATPSLESRLNASKGKGSPLSKNTRNEMESAFYADFNKVKIHTGSESIQMNKELNSKAFTHRSNIYFNKGQFNTDSPDGKRLLAHELTHTIQQGYAIQKKKNSENSDMHATQNRSNDKSGVLTNEVSSLKNESYYPLLSFKEESEQDSFDDNFLKIDPKSIQRQNITQNLDQQSFSGPIEEEAKIEELTSQIMPKREPNLIQKKVNIKGKDQKYKRWRNRRFRRWLRRKQKKRQLRKTMLAIYKEMNKSKRDYSFYNSENMYRFLLKRAYLIIQMGHVNKKKDGKKCCGYARPRNKYKYQVNAEARKYWVNRGTSGQKEKEFDLTKLGEKYADIAIKKLFVPQRRKSKRTLTDCTRIIVALHYYSLMKTLGEKKFRNLVRQGKLKVSIARPWEKPVAYRIKGVVNPGGVVNTEYVDSVSKLIPGDHVYFWNHYTYPDLTNALKKRRTSGCKQKCSDIWRGEHAVYMGKKKGKRIFQGHGTGKLSETRLKRTLLRYYNCHVEEALNCRPPLKRIKTKDPKTKKRINYRVRKLTFKEIPGLFDPKGKIRVRKTIF